MVTWSSIGTFGGERRDGAIEMTSAADGFAIENKRIDFCMFVGLNNAPELDGLFYHVAKFDLSS